MSGSHRSRPWIKVPFSERAAGAGLEVALEASSDPFIGEFH
jgi:hypothetical protein